MPRVRKTGSRLEPGTSFSAVYVDKVVKSHFSLPQWERIKGRGDHNILYLFSNHPHPDPLPSRERGVF
jgi:hypothetical protein